MADTCIVCLGDLASAADASVNEDLNSKKSPSWGSTADSSTYAQVPSETIAHLLPCGHDLHNECLKPWVERANSCPICRQNFNIVQLKSDIQGPCISSYSVQDKLQVADLDPSMIIEEDVFEESSAEPCLLCEHFGDEEVLLLCDGCSGSCHTYCAGLSSVPEGPWFCHFCLDDPTIQYNANSVTRTRRTRAQQTRLGSRLDQPSDAWALVWQSVWDNLNIDLDFPFDEEPELTRRTQHQLQEFNQWQQRFRIAESHGVDAAASFRDAAATILDGRSFRSRGPTPHPESQEEISAWNAFDKAREIESIGSSASQARNKRKSAPASPVEPQAEPERRLKRPRIRRPQDTNERSALPNSHNNHPLQTAPIQSSTSRLPSDNETGGPSFFQSLLREVETTPSTSDNSDRHLQSRNAATSNSTDQSSPCSSTSPSSHPSPRLRPISPTPLRSSRPASPPLTSRIEPVFGQQHSQFPPVSPESVLDKDDHPGDDSSNARSSPQDTSRPQGRPPESQTTQARGSRATSPSTEQMRSMKAEIQRMVSTALKPAYKKQEIDSDQFTGINQKVSRILYDKVCDTGNLDDVAKTEKWQIEANQHVEAWLKRLKKSNELPVMT